MTAGDIRAGGNNRSRFGPVVAAAAVGLALGFVVDLIWPNTVYGYQLVAAGVAFLVVLVAAAVGRRVPLALPVAAAGAVGLVAGMMAGLALLAGPPSTVAGSLEVRLERPIEATLASAAICGTATSTAFPLVFTAEDGSDLTLADGRGLAVAATLGDGAPVGVKPRADGLGIELRVTDTRTDGSPTATWMGSDERSALTVTGTAAAGSMSFAGLVIHPDSEQPTPIDLVGTITWEC
ncbi:MAG TPA: hypothetical protein VFO50_05015 [Candidatus Limnocylindrales bacterium]|nr:hypothetical protein [Candidatus Limnocylindrales bacterium]